MNLPVTTTIPAVLSSELLLNWTTLIFLHLPQMTLNFPKEDF